MTSKRDMRRPDLVIPWVDVPKDKDDKADMSTTMASTLPMAAMFTKNKMIGWASLVFATQTWLAETPEQAGKAGTPSYLSIGMSVMAVAVTYLPLFMPPGPDRRANGTGTEAPGPRAA